MPVAMAEPAATGADGWGADEWSVLIAALSFVFSISISSAALWISYCAHRTAERNSQVAERNRRADFLLNDFTNNVVVPLHGALTNLAEALRQFHALLRLGTAAPSAADVTSLVQKQLIPALQGIERVLDSVNDNHKTFAKEWQDRLEKVQEEGHNALAIYFSSYLALTEEGKIEAALRGHRIMEDFRRDLASAQNMRLREIHDGRHNGSL